MLEAFSHSFLFLVHGRKILEIDFSPGGRPVTVATTKMVNKVHGISLWLTGNASQYSWDFTGKSTFHSDLRKNRKLSACWVPRLLTVGQKHLIRQVLLQANLNLLEAGPANFLQSFTGQTTV